MFVQTENIDFGIDKFLSSNDVTSLLTKLTTHEDKPTNCLQYFHTRALPLSIVATFTCSLRLRHVLFTRLTQIHKGITYFQWDPSST